MSQADLRTMRFDASGPLACPPGQQRRATTPAATGRLRRWPRLVVAGVLALLAAACIKVPEAEPRLAPVELRPLPITPAPDTPGDPAAGRRLFQSVGCGGCHTLRNISTATGVAGPHLDNVVLRPTLAGGEIPMTFDTLTAFLLDPPAVDPGTSMPNVGLTPDQARDIAAYLYSLPYNPAP